MNDDHGQHENDVFNAHSRLLRVSLTLATQLARMRADRRRIRENQRENAWRTHQAQLQQDKSAADAQLREQAAHARERLAQARRTRDAQRRIAEHHLSKVDRSTDWVDTAPAAEIALRYRQAAEFRNESGVAQSVAERVEDHAREHHGIHLDMLGTDLDPAEDQLLKAYDRESNIRDIAAQLLDEADRDDRDAGVPALTDPEPEPENDTAHPTTTSGRSPQRQLAWEKIQADLRTTRPESDPPQPETDLHNNDTPAARYDTEERRGLYAAAMAELDGVTDEAVIARVLADVSSAYPPRQAAAEGANTLDLTATGAQPSRAVEATTHRDRGPEL